jgi:hypothetical protein
MERGDPLPDTGLSGRSSDIFIQYKTIKVIQLVFFFSLVRYQVRKLLFCHFKHGAL